MQGRRDSKSRLNSAAQHMLTNNTSLRENSDIRKYDSSNKLEDLQLELQQKEMTIAALQRNYEGISKVYKDEKGKSSEWVEKVATLEKENSILRSKIQTFESQKQKALQDLEKTQEEIVKLLKGYEEIRAVKTDLVTTKVLLEKKKKECDEYFNKAESLKSENDVLRKVKIDLEAVVRKLKGDVEGYDKELRKLQSEYEEYKQNNIVLENKYAEALNELDALRFESQRRINSGESAENQILMLKQQMSVDKSELSVIRAKNAELSVLMMSLKDQLELKESKLSNIEKTLNDSIKDFNGKISNLTRENSDLQLKISNLSDAQKNALALQEEIDRLKIELLSKNEELEKWKNEAKSMNENLNTVLSDSEKKHKELENEIRMESARKLALLSQSEQVKDMLSRKEQEFKDYLSLKERSLADCKIKLQEYAKSVDDLTRENNKLKDDFNDANQMHIFTQKSLQQSIEDNNKFKESLSRLITEIENLKKKLLEETANKQKNQSLENELNQKSSQIKHLNSTISDLELKILQLSETSKSLESEISSLSSQLTEKSSQLLESEDQAKSFQKSLQDTEQEKKSLTLSKNHLENELQKLHKLISSLTKELQDSKDEVKKEKDLRNKFEIQLSGKEMEIAKFENLLMIEKSNYKNSVEDNANMMRRMQEIKEDRDRIRGLEEDSVRRMKSVNEKEKSIGKALERLENALNSLETNLACHSCFGPLEGAVVCVPCGHLHCGNCKQKLANNCQECENPVKQTVSVSRFDEIYGKIVYKKQAINDMKHLLSHN